MPASAVGASVVGVDQHIDRIDMLVFVPSETRNSKVTSLLLKPSGAVNVGSAAVASDKIIFGPLVWIH